MALTTTVSGSSSDSYASLAEANTYFEKHKKNFDATWDALSDTNKEIYLRAAALALDTLENWRGYKPDSEQALEFPRELGWISYYQATLYPSSEIDTRIKNAQCEIVMMAVRRVDSNSDTIETRFETSLSALSNTVNIGYQQRSDQKMMETIAGNSIHRIRQYMIPWRASRRLQRA